MKEKQLTDFGYRKYDGKDIDVYFNLKLCKHSGVCVKGLPEVFDTKKKPWINADNASANEIKQLIDKCPSGALKYAEDDLKIKVLKKEQKYYINFENEMIAEMTYSKAGESLIIIDHTYVDPNYRGKDLGKKLVYEAVREAREGNYKIIPLCPFARAIFLKNKDIQDVMK